MLPDLSLCSTIMNESDTQSINSVDETANFKERLTKGREVSESEYNDNSSNEGRWECGSKSSKVKGRKVL